jgi:transposase InsO family protein
VTGEVERDPLSRTPVLRRGSPRRGVRYASSHAARSLGVVGWSIADDIRTELVVDALQMARWQRRPQPGTIVHADRGTQYSSWRFGHRLRSTGVLGSMGRVASSVGEVKVSQLR